MKQTLLLLVLALGACGKDMAVEVEKLADKVCACKDAACADAVVDELVTLAKANKKGRGDQKRANDAGRRFGECAVKAGSDPSKLIEKMKSLGD